MKYVQWAIDLVLLTLSTWNDVGRKKEEEEHVTKGRWKLFAVATYCFGIEVRSKISGMCSYYHYSKKIELFFFTFSPFLSALCFVVRCIRIEMFDNLGADFYRILGSTCSGSNCLLSFHRKNVSLLLFKRKEKNMECILNEHFLHASLGMENGYINRWRNSMNSIE